jgi:hypothetical protein
MDPTKLNLHIYDFLLRSIREDDQRSGKLLERYLQGMQDSWVDIQKRIFQVKTLWSVTEVEDEYLKYQKNIVGWTKDLDYITNRMDYEQLRRLISVSVALWKAKGPEDTIEDLLRFVLQTRVRILNWFDYRWLIDENYLTLANQGLDAWLLSIEDGTEQTYSVMKIVDDGTLDRTLSKYLLELMRASGERIEIQYLKFMDLFDTDSDTALWNAYSDDIGDATPLDVSGGTAKLSNSSVIESMFINVPMDYDWSDYAVSVKIRGDASTTGRFGLLIHAQDFIPGFAPVYGHPVHLSVANNAVIFDITQISFSPWGQIYPDVYYDLTVRVIDVDGTNKKYEIYIDGELVHTEINSAFGSGYIGIEHGPNAVLEVNEIEIAAIPPDGELMDINP